MPDVDTAINISPSMTVNDVVSRYRSTLRVFARHRIDACCGGNATIAEAAADKGLNVDDLLAELREQAGRDGTAAESTGRY